MKSSESRETRHWTRHATAMRPTPKHGNGKTKTLSPHRSSRSDLQLGPYESSYDVTLGYGFERSIVRP